MFTILSFRMKYIGLSIFWNGSFFLEKRYAWKFICSALFRRFADYFPESFYFSLVHYKFLTSLWPKEYEFLYSDFHSFLENILDFLVFIGHCLIEPYRNSRIARICRRFLKYQSYFFLGNGIYSVFIFLSITIEKNNTIPDTWSQNPWNLMNKRILPDNDIFSKWEIWEEKALHNNREE